MKKKYEAMHIPQTIEPHVWATLTVLGLFALAVLLWFT
jgi:hypothetical protein